MRVEHSTTPQGLSVLCQEAGKQAASWAPDAGQGGTTAASATQWPWKVGLMSGCCLLALVVIAAPHFGEPDGTESTPEFDREPLLQAHLGMTATWPKP